VLDKTNNRIRNNIIYQILIDRFSGFKDESNWKKPKFIGGTVKGIIEKIPYLQNLGIDTIWISPFYQTNTYHGYHITNFFEIDSHFGTKDDLQELVTIVHESNMNIIADFVPNHCSIKHPYFIDAYNKKNSKYKNWFYFTKWPDKYKSFLSFNEIPKLNLENDETREHIVQAAKYWLSFGFDGFRLDHVIGPSHQFWIYFVREIKKLYPSIILIGEAWMQGLRFHDLNTIKLKVKYLKWIRGNASDYLLKSYQGILDGVLDFHGQQIIHKYGFYYDYQINNIINLLNKHYKRFHSTFILPLFLDNHDMDRI
jgi:glycosidase